MAAVLVPLNQNPVLPPPLDPPGVHFIVGGALQAPIGIVHDLPAENVLRNDIEQLCNATLTIDTAFQEIGQKLSQVTKEQKKRVKLYKICYDLEIRWKRNHETYKKLLWRSREVAGKAQFAVDDFRKAFLPCLRDPSTTVPQRQQLAQNHIKELEEKSETSQKLSQEFRDFVGTLEAYIADFSRAVEGLDCHEQTEKCGALENELYTARAAMNVLNEQVKGLGWRFSKDVLVTGVLGLLTFLAPVWWATWLGVVATGISLDSNIQDLQPWLRVKSGLAVWDCIAIENKLDSEQACLRQMVNIQLALEDARPIVQDVTSKLGAFSHVWATIVADIRQIILHAQSCGETEAAHMLFEQRVQNLEALYECLSEALHSYQVTVRMPEGLDEEKSWYQRFHFPGIFGFT